LRMHRSLRAILQPSSRPRRTPLRRPRHKQRGPPRSRRHRRRAATTAQPARMDPAHRFRSRLGARDARCLRRRTRRQLGPLHGPAPHRRRGGPAPRDARLHGDVACSALSRAQPARPGGRTGRSRAVTNRAGFTTAMGLVIEREIMVRLKSKAFMISTILSIVILGVLVGVSGALPSLFSSTDRVAVTSASAQAVAGIDDIEPVDVDDADEARALVTAEEVEAAVVESPDSPTGLAVLSLRSAPESLIASL